jgi:hypothetical protein
MTAVPRGPINKAPGGCSPRDVLAAALHEPLANIELGTYDERILAWLAGWDDPTVMTIASLLHRARAAQPLPAAEAVTISRAEFARLTQADEELGALHAAGVDNWEGYGEAMRP